VQVSDEQAVSTMKLIESLEEFDDVQKCYTNLDISDAVMAKVRDGEKRKRSNMPKEPRKTKPNLWHVWHI